VGNPTPLNLDDQRGPDGGRRDADTNGSISWKGIRLPALLAALLTVGGGATYLGAKPDDLKARVIVLETKHEIEKHNLERRLNSIERKLDRLVSALPDKE
jgi:hypothetical protein